MSQLQELMSAWLQSQHALEMLNASLADGYNTQAHGRAPNGKPKHASKLTGQAYTQDVLSCRHEERLLKCLRMPLATFHLLCMKFRENNLLVDNANTTIEHQVHMFLYIVTGSSSNRNLLERFQHSGESISRHFHHVLDAINHIESEYIQHPTPSNTNLSTVPPEITNNPKFYPFFKNCLGAIDSSLIPVSVSPSVAATHRTRKGFTAQNAFLACTFDCAFEFVLAAWEGSAHDSLVLSDAIKKGFRVPKNKFYLAHAGYASSPKFLTPYRNVRYHLKEQIAGHQAYVLNYTFLLIE